MTIGGWKGVATTPWGARLGPAMPPWGAACGVCPVAPLVFLALETARMWSNKRGFPSQIMRITLL